MNFDVYWWVNDKEPFTLEGSGGESFETLEEAWKCFQEKITAGLGASLETGK